MTEVLTNTTSGVAVLVDEDDGETPLKVRGVALGENDVTYGNEQVQVQWPKPTLEKGAASLEGTKIVDPSEHWAPEGGDVDEDYPREPPEETWVGEITDVTYEPGMGPMYEGEITDPDMAQKIRDGEVEPSPTVFHERAEVDDENWVATNITEWRDLAMVDRGASEGASIEPAEPAESTVAAMSEGEVVSALSSAFDGSEGSHETTGAESPVDDDNSDNQFMDDLTEEEKTMIRTARTLDNPTVVNENIASLGEEAEQYEDPTMLEESEYESITEDVERIKDVLGGILADDRGLREETVSSMSLGAVLGEFEDDEGDINVSALEQNPESGSADDSVETPDEGGDDGPDEEVEEKIAALEQKKAALRNTSAADRIDEKIAALKEE